MKDKTFVFDVSVFLQSSKQQGKINLAEKMNYFYEALIS